MHFFLKRLKEDNVAPTIGVLFRPQGKPFFTLEPPWLDNQNNVSCIPKGEYRFERYLSPTKGDCFILHDVPGRTFILIHIGNYLKDTEGCILIGNHVSVDFKSIQESAKALELFKKEVGSGFNILTIF